MKRIFKYSFEIEDGPIEIEMPARSVILSVHMQHGYPCVWALVDDDEHEKVKKVLRAYATGSPVEVHPVCLRFLGTLQWQSVTQSRYLSIGELVFHIFEQLELPGGCHA